MGIRRNFNSKKIFRAKKMKSELATKRKNLYRLMKYGEYENCEHLWGLSMDEYREYDCFCVKCGINDKAMRLTTSNYIN